MTTPGLARVLVALGAAISSRPAVETGVGLAAAMGAALDALFVEDVNLLRLGSLPFASEISALTGARRSLAVGELERALRVEAARLEQLLAAAAARQGIPWSFAVTRGELLAEAMTREADLIVLGAPTRPSAPAQDPERAGPVVALFDGSAEALRALAATTRLARALERTLVILVPAGEGKAQRALRQRAVQWLAAERVDGVVVPLTAAQPALVEAMRARRGRVLALPASALSERQVTLAMLVADLACPVIIVR
jgi:predicted phosphoribosyltransferase